MTQPTPALETPVLSVSGVWKLFGKGVDRFARSPVLQWTDQALKDADIVGAVRDASFDVAAGEVFVIMGLSGSGKSTLVRCLTRLVEPTVGTILLGALDLSAANDQELLEVRRKRMGMVFQHFALLPNRTVMGNIAFPLLMQGATRTKAEERARELMDVVDLGGREERFPHELSGGQQQRVGIARSLATDPDLWLLDEPFSALDPLIRTDLQDEVIRLQKSLNKTVVFITHDLDEAIKIADRIAIMESGSIVQIGTPEDLVVRPATDYVRRFVSKVPPARVVTAGSLMTPSDVKMDQISPVLVSDTVQEIAPRLIDGQTSIPVVSDDGSLQGALDVQAALKVLARAG